MTKPETTEVKMEVDTEAEDNTDNAEEKPESVEVQEGSDKITLDDLVDSSSIVSAELDIPSDLDVAQPARSTQPVSVPSIAWQKRLETELNFYFLKLHLLFYAICVI